MFVSGTSSSPAPVAPTQAQRAPAADVRPDLGRVERTYQVAEEPSQNWSPKLFGAIPVGSLGGERKLTITEGKLLDKLTANRGIMGLSKFKDIHDDALAIADARSPRTPDLPAHAERQIASLPPREQESARRAYGSNDGHNDAFRHAYWNARLTTEFGESWTRQFATAHEGSNPGASTREAMDLYNNEVGRRIATENPNASPRELADLVGRALRDGELVVLGRGGHLEWSNRVANGDHGVTVGLQGVRDVPMPAGNASAR